MMSRGIANVVRELATGPSQAQSAFWATLARGQPELLIGSPVWLNSAMITSLSAATASSDHACVVGDFRAGYYVVRRVGMSVINNWVVSTSHNRPTGEYGVTAVWRTAGLCVSPDSFRCVIV
jgi:HK97 family phage major capsid protein